MAACTCLRLFMIAAFVGITEFYFDGTIVPVAIVIMSYTLFSVALYGYQYFREKA